MDKYAKIKRWFIFTIAILVISLMGLTMGGRERVSMVENTIGNIISPIQKGLYNVGEFIADRVRPVISIWELEDENQRLLEENERLSKEVVEAILTQNELSDLSSLREALNYTIENDLDNHVTANVISKDVGNWYNIFQIDRGLEDGITKYSTVMNGRGLIGQVYEVGSNWAKVITIIDSKNSIGFEIIDGDQTYDGILRGSLSDYIKGELFDPNAKVNKNNKVVTSGLGIYPKGILIGYISEVTYNDDNLLTEITVIPRVNFQNLDRVFIIPNERFDDD